MKRLAACLVVLSITSVLFTAVANAQVDQRSAAQAVLNQRLAAIAAGDEQKFVDTVDPKASEAFKTAQSKLFSGLHSMPFSKYQLTIRTNDSGDLAQGLSLVGKYGAQSAYLPETRATYRLGAYDDRDAIDSYWYTYVERDGHWYVAADNDAELLGLDSSRELWDNGALSTVASDHVLTIALKGDAARANSLSQLAEKSMQVFTSRWTQPWSQKAVLIDPGSAEEAARILRIPNDVAHFSAFTYYVPIRDVGWEPSAPRIYVQDDVLFAQSTATQRDTLVHELTHVATAQRSGPFTPRWLHEGLAEWVRFGMPASVNPVVASPKLPTSGDFASEVGKTIGQAYAASTSAVAFMGSHYGEQTPIDFFNEIGARRVVPGSSSYNLDDSMHAVTGDSLATFVDKWDDMYRSTTAPSASALTDAGAA